MKCKCRKIPNAIIIPLAFLLFLKCNENAGMVPCFPFIFHFATDINSISISNLSLVLKGEKEISYNKSEYVELFLDSVDFFRCPIDSPTCEDRGYYYQVPGYTNRTLMSKYFDFRMDLPCSIDIMIQDSNHTTIATSKMELPARRAEICNYLIYCANKFDLNSPKLADFITAISRSWMQDHKILKYSFACQNQVDSIYVVWQSYK